MSAKGTAGGLRRSMRLSTSVGVVVVGLLAAATFGPERAAGAVTVIGPPTFSADAAGAANSPTLPGRPGQGRSSERAFIGPATLADVMVSNTDPSLASGGNGGSEPAIAVNPANPDQIVISSFYDTWGADYSIFGSTDRGRTWTVYNSVPAPPGVAGVTGCPCDQTFAFGRDGTLYGTFLLNTEPGDDNDPGAKANVVTGSTRDFTRADAWRWDGATAQLTNHLAPLGMADQPQVIVDRDPVDAGRDNAYIAYDEYTNHLAQVAVSAGTTPVDITRDLSAGHEGQPEYTNPGLRPAGDHRNGTVYALYQTSTLIPPATTCVPCAVTYHLNRSTDAGRSWSLNGTPDGLVVDTVPSDQQAGTDGYSFGGVNALLGGVDSVAVDPTDGEVYVVYGHDLTSEGKGNQLQIRRLRHNGSGGLTIGVPSTITGASSAALPSVAVTTDGTVGVLYDTYDGTSTDGHPIFSAHFAGSTDHGAAFTDRVLQTFETPPPNGNPRQRELGDYQQLTADGTTFFGVFTGNRNRFGNYRFNIDPIFFHVSETNSGAEPGRQVGAPPCWGYHRIDDCVGPHV